MRVFPDPQADPGENGDGAARAIAESAVRGALRGVRGKKSALTFFGNLARVRCGGPADFNGALRRGAMEVRQAGAALVISDLLDPRGYADGLEALLGRGFHIQVLQVLAPEELNPSTFGDLRLVDSETGAEQEVTFGKYRLKAYRQAVENYTQKLREYCRAHGIGFFRAASDTALERLLLQELRTEGVVG